MRKNSAFRSQTSEKCVFISEEMNGEIERIETVSTERDLIYFMLYYHDTSNAGLRDIF